MATSVRPIPVQFQSNDTEQARLEKLRRLSKAIDDLSTALSQVQVQSSGGTPTPDTTTAFNLGTGEGIFKNKTGTQLNLRSLLAGVGIVLTLVNDDIVVSATSTEADLEPLLIAGAF